MTPRRNAKGYMSRHSRVEGGNPAAFPQKKRCNLKKRTPPIHTGAFYALPPLQGRRGAAIGMAVCKLPFAGMCGYSAEAF